MSQDLLTFGTLLRNFRQILLNPVLQSLTTSESNCRTHPDRPQPTQWVSFILSPCAYYIASFLHACQKCKERSLGRLVGRSLGPSSLFMQLISRAIFVICHDLMQQDVSHGGSSETSNSYGYHYQVLSIYYPQFGTIPNCLISKQRRKTGLKFSKIPWSN